MLEIQLNNDIDQFTSIYKDLLKCLLFSTTVTEYIIDNPRINW